MRAVSLILVVTCTVLSGAQGFASSTCPEEQEADQMPPADLTPCRLLDPVVRAPRSLPLNEYEAKLGEYLAMNCHRNLAGGWKVDKRIRDTGPWVATYQNG